MGEQPLRRGQPEIAFDQSRFGLASRCALLVANVGAGARKEREFVLSPLVYPAHVQSIWFVPSLGVARVLPRSIAPTCFP